jgi:PII-like signaling protein
MIPVKRLEIVVDAPYSTRIVSVLQRHGLTGWSILRNVTGSGERGSQWGDEITGVSSNNMIVTTCPPEALDALMGDLSTLLTRAGGICLVSDALWLPH